MRIFELYHSCICDEHRSTDNSNIEWLASGRMTIVTDEDDEVLHTYSPSEWHYYYYLLLFISGGMLIVVVALVMTKTIHPILPFVVCFIRHCSVLTFTNSQGELVHTFYTPITLYTSSVQQSSLLLVMRNGREWTWMEYALDDGKVPLLNSKIFVKNTVETWKTKWIRSRGWFWYPNNGPKPSI